MQPEAVVKAGTEKKEALVNTPGIKKDTAAALVKNEPFPAEKKDSLPSAAPARRLRPLVNKAAELLTDTSYVAVFVDESNDKFDTIRVSIPFNEVIAFGKKEPLPAIDTQVTADAVVAAKKIIDSLNNLPATVPAKKDSILYDTAVKETVKAAPVQPILTAAVKADSSAVIPATVKDTATVIALQQTPDTLKNDTVKTVSTVKDSFPVITAPAPAAATKRDEPAAAIADSSKLAKTPPQPLFLNSDCKEIAGDADIDKLRIKMLLLTADEEKIGLARKLFKQKCLLALQVKALSELFKTDDGKYKWFDAVYPFVSDSGNFYKLGELIKDEYYLNRFKAMLRN